MPAFTNKRTAHRWRLLTLMLAGVFCAFGSFWMLQLMENGDAGAGRGLRTNEPDYIVENFSFVRMSESGQPAYVISGRRLAHHPVGDVSEVELPVVRSIDARRPGMTMHANRARIHHKQNQVDLYGSVDVQRPAAPDVQPMRLRTEALTVLPDEEILKTDLLVDMTLGDATVRGTGMVANNATRQLHLASRGQIVYPPRQAPNAN